MPKLRKRAKKRVRRLHKKTVSLSKVNEVWKDYVQLAIIDPLIKYGKVQIDKNTSIEIVAEPLLSSNISHIIGRGVGIQGGVLKKSANLHKGRPDYVYHIELKDDSFKEGKLIFKPSALMRKALFNSLVNTNNQYRIRQ